MNDSCCMMEDNQNEQQQRQLLLVPKENNLDGKHKKAISLYQIDQGLRRAQDNRLQLYWNQSERLRKQVQRVRDTAESRKEEMKQATMKKQEMLNKTLAEAQLRRNQYLEVARQNAREHVIKVRTIANTNQVSKRVLLWRQRAQSQSQLWNAEWRRSRALALKARNACLSSSSHKSSSQPCEAYQSDTSGYSIKEKHEAASLIQFFWRLHFVERIFSKLHLTWECCAEEGFEATKNKILDEEAEKAAVTVVHLFYPRSRRSMTTNEVRRLARLFLTSFVIAAHPQHVLEQPDSGLEKSVVESARLLLGYLTDPHVNAVTLALRARSTWKKYRVLYEEWERSDRERLIEGIMKDYVELETMRLKVDYSVSTKQAFNRQRRLSPNIAPWKGKDPQTIGAIWLPQIRKRQSRLRAALFRVGGHKALDDLNSNIQGIQDHFETIRVEDDETRKVQDSQWNAISKDEYEFAQSGMNEVFAHEIMLDVEEFIRELETPEEYKNLLIIARQAYRDNLQEALCETRKMGENDASSAPPPAASEQLLKLIAEVRDKLLAILPQNSCETTDICKTRLLDHLDMDILRNQLYHYAFHVDDAIHLLKLFTETLHSVQAAERDEELKVWEDAWLSEISSVSDCSSPLQKRKLLSLVGNRLCDILDRLDNIEKDIVISKIRILEPILKLDGPQWEDRRFQEKMNQGIIENKLPNTTAWLTKSAMKLKQLYTTFDYIHLVQSEGDSMKRFLEASFIYLVENDDEQVLLPEVLKLDERRLHMLRENLKRSIYVASLDGIIRRFLKQKKVEWDCTLEQSWKDFIGGWKDKKLDIVEYIDKELERWLEATLEHCHAVFSRPQDGAFLLSLWRQVIRGNEPISSLLRRRLVDFLYRHFLFNVSFTCPRKQVQSLGLGYVADDIMDMLQVMKTTTSHMLAVHFHRLRPMAVRIAKHLVVVNESV